MASRQEIESGRAFVRLFLKNDMSRQLVRALRNAQAKLRQFGQSAMMTGRRIATVGVAMAAPFAFATRTFAQFDDAMREVGAVTQAVGKDFDRLTDKAKKLGASTSFTAIEVALLMAELGRANFDPGDIDRMTGSVLSLARATKTEAAIAAGIMATAIRQFGLDASDAAMVADTLTTGANKSFNTLESLGESLRFVGKVSKDFNLDLGDTVAVLGTLGNVGIQGSMAGTAMRRIQLALGAEATKLKGIFGVDFVDANDNAISLVDALQAVADATKDMGTATRAAKFSEAFGLRGITGAAAIAGNITGTRELRDAIAEAGGIAKKTADDMDAGLGGAFRILRSAVEGVQIAIGEALAPRLKMITEFLTRSAQSAIKWIKANKGMVVAAAATATGVIAVGVALVAMGVASHVAAFGFGILASVATAVLFPLKLIGFTLKVVVGGLGVVMKAFSFTAKLISGTFTAALWGLKATLTAVTVGFKLMVGGVSIAINAITTITSAIAALTTLAPVLGFFATLVGIGLILKAIGSFANTLESSIAGVRGAVDGVKSAVVSAGTVLSDFAGKTRQAFTRMIDVVKGASQTLVTDVGKSWETLQALFATGNFSEAWKVGLSLAKLEWVRFKNWLVKLWEDVTPVVNKAIINVAESIGSILTNLKIGWGDIWDTLQSGLKTFLGVLDKALDSVRKYIASTQAFLGEEFSTDLGAPLGSLVSGPRSAEDKSAADEAARKQGQSISDAITSALVTTEKTPVEMAAAIDARGKELDDATKAYNAALISAKEAVEEAAKKQQAIGALGLPGVPGVPGAPGIPGGAAGAVPSGVALTATYSAAAARIAGFQPATGGPEEKMGAEIASVNENTKKMVVKLGEMAGWFAKNANLQTAFEQFLAGWKVT